MRKVDMLKTLTIVLATGAAVLAGGRVRGQSTGPVAIEDPEAYAVYASVVSGEWTVTSAHAKRLVVQRETATDNQCFPSGRAMETEWRPVAESYKLQNAAVRLVLPDRDLHYPYVVIPKTEILELWQKPLGDLESGWTRFYSRYPDSGGYVELSAVGFDSTKTHALVYVAHHCGGLCGGGTHHLLQKVDGVWRKADVPGVQTCVWIS